MAFMQMMSEGGTSYWSWACSLTSVIRKTVSKHAIFKRMTPAWVATLKELLERVIAQQSATQVKQEVFKFFNRVLLQDSTTLKLPAVLSHHFKGNVSGGKQNALVKFQVIINAFGGGCALMEWINFTVNEQKLSDRILRVARAGDLVIRDLGYFVLQVFKQMNSKGIYFLSRCRYGVGFYQIDSGNEIQLQKLLRGKRHIDCEVICGTKEQLKVRLVAIKLSESIAAQRRRKAKQDRDKRLNHTKQYYQLLGYAIFITNVDEQIWDHQQIAEAYRVRWNIETLFKSWKSCFHIEKMLPEDRVHVLRTESILYLLLLYIAWFEMIVYIPLSYSAQLTASRGQNQTICLSRIKVANMMIKKIMDWITGTNLSMERELFYYCCYEKRKDRMNAKQFLQQFSNP